MAKELTLRDVMEDIISNTFKRLSNVYNEHREGKDSDIKPTKEGSRLVFPMYGQHRDNETRISEQELRFAFVEEFNKSEGAKALNLFYSVETPTRDKYSGFSQGKDNTPAQDDKGRSGEFDMVIYNNKLERVCLIEFKANNSAKNQHAKDFVKLNNYKEGDETVLRYFIEVIKAYDDDTIVNLKDKLGSNKCLKAIFKCYVLEGERNSGQRGGEEITDKITFKDK